MKRYVNNALLIGAILSAITLIGFLYTCSRSVTQTTVAVFRQASEQATPRTPAKGQTGNGRQVIEVGRSSRGLPITAYVYGDADLCVLILGGIHGDEPSSVSLSKALNSWFDQQPTPPAVKIILVPIVNPDGVIAQTRTNANGVDINRNFPTSAWKPQTVKGRYWPGKYPSSEPETSAVVKLISRHQPQLIISIHAPLDCVNWDGPAEGLAKTIAEISGHPLKQEIGYQTPGSLGQYAGIEGKIPTVTLELEDYETEVQMLSNVKAVTAAIHRAASK